MNPTKISHLSAPQGESERQSKIEGLLTLYIGGSVIFGCLVLCLLQWMSNMNAPAQANRNTFDASQIFALLISIGALIPGAVALGWQLARQGEQSFFRIGVYGTVWGLIAQGVITLLSIWSCGGIPLIEDWAFRCLSDFLILPPIVACFMLSGFSLKKRSWVALSCSLLVLFFLAHLFFRYYLILF